ncbi:hypothetical protein [Cerasicoccus arenae]|uniref:Uncharacterized protein n=1 Tax=Cerasicoccus arenae TaxID=424488 RepID=A0A8J3GEE5_9BACT|nr:hypothetical protein [Cerasicoccus arenae]MBK1858675.1 hypothetical protein [Cerasicoccus arenae]GHB98250.1 hypothetical protein GCM10007047_12860 [Cerasicoccus arenae]
MADHVSSFPLPLKLATLAIVIVLGGSYIWHEQAQSQRDKAKTATSQLSDISISNSESIRLVGNPDLVESDVLEYYHSEKPVDTPTKSLTPSSELVNAIHDYQATVTSSSNPSTGFTDSEELKGFFSSADALHQLSETSEKEKAPEKKSP